MLYWRSAFKPLSLFSDGLPQQWVKDISDDYGGVLPEFLEYIHPHIVYNDIEALKGYVCSRRGIFLLVAFFYFNEKSSGGLLIKGKEKTFHN